MRPRPVQRREQRDRSARAAGISAVSNPLIDGTVVVDGKPLHPVLDSIPGQAVAVQQDIVITKPTMKGCAGPWIVPDGNSNC
jgi:hypothetical protein